MTITFQSWMEILLYCTYIRKNDNQWLNWYLVATTILVIELQCIYHPTGYTSRIENQCYLHLKSNI